MTRVVLAFLLACDSPPPVADGGFPHSDAGELGPRITTESWERLRALSPDELPTVPPDATNAYADDPRAALLGQRLFFDTGFSGVLLDSDHDGTTGSLGLVGETGRVSCASCHIPTAAFNDDRSVRAQVSLGAGWGIRKTPSLLDIGHATLLMWDGRFDALWNQPFGALENGVEMNGSRLFAAIRIHDTYREEYEAVFGAIDAPLDDPARFPRLAAGEIGCRALETSRLGVSTGVECRGVPGDGAEYDAMSSDDQRAVTEIWVNAGKAMAAYERLLACGPSRFDAWMRGDASALTDDEQRGAALFVGQRQDGTTFTGCDRCHSGPFLTDRSFHNVGLEPAGVGPAATFYDYDDRGAAEGLLRLQADPLNTRGAFSDGEDGRVPDTLPENAEGAFRTPSLRCVASRPAFMHTGQFRTLADAVAFFSRGGDPSGYPGTNELERIDLDAGEQRNLEAFLRALDGDGPPDELLRSP